eukprot:14151509-Alexandrium_andersonii.AAC.1
MSASLVGSEMCIRDRQALDAWPARPPNGHSVLDYSNGVRFEVLFARAVSYTHLTLPTICSV